MVVVPLAKPAGANAASRPSESESLDWVALTAAAALASGGALLLCGKPKSALVAAATGTALAMLDQQETVSLWWNALPAYLAEIQDMLGRAQTTLSDIEAQRERIHEVLAR